MPRNHSCGKKLLEACKEFHQTIINAESPEIGRCLVAKEILDRFRKPGTGGKIVLDISTSAAICNDFLTKILVQDQFEAGAALMWGPDAFTWEPESTRMVWEDLFEYSQELVMGAGSMGKTYSAGAWFYLDWRRDPHWTSLKVMSVTQEHAKRNIFAHMKHLHESSAVPMPGSVALAESIQAEGGDDRHGIHLVTIPQGDEGKGRLRGFHPIPRSGKPHPVFGLLSRVRLALDEAEVIPGGVWEDVDNLLLSEDQNFDQGRVMVFGATNPKDPASKFGQRSEPPQGFDGHGFDIETSMRWISRMGWHVLRIDGARCENVIQRRIVFKGLMTFDGYNRYLANGGANSPSYYTMARGWFPPQGVAQVAIPAHAIKRAVGMYRFTGPVRHCISCDQAFEGEDKYVVTLGRVGEADGWTDRAGKLHKFKAKDGVELGHEDETELRRRVLQVDQQIEFDKKPTLEQTHAIMAFCKMMHVVPQMVILDRTGNGTGVYDNLTTLFRDKQTGQTVVGVHFGEASTKMPILSDDAEPANELYDGIVTELIYALGRFMEFDYVKFSPSFSHVDVMAEAGRRWAKQKKMLMRVESKGEYKRRTQMKSPDKLDSASLLVHLVRLKAEVAPAMLPGAVKPDQSDEIIKRHSVVDAVEYIDFDS